MKCYAAAVGAGRNRDALAAAGWGIFLSPGNRRDPGAFPYGLDNGAWPAFTAWVKAREAEGMSKEQAVAAWMAGGWREHGWDEAAFERTLQCYGPRADFVILPDIVGAGLTSLQLSLRWQNRCMAECGLVLIAVQDGMEPADLEPYVGARVGIFLGGSTEWKLATAETWGRWCAARPCPHPLNSAEEPRTGCWFHFARVNTLIRFRLANAAGADSVDGSSATKFANTLPLLERGRRQQDLYAPRRMGYATEP